MHLGEPVMPALAAALTRGRTPLRRCSMAAGRRRLKIERRAAGVNALRSATARLRRGWHG